MSYFLRSWAEQVLQQPIVSPLIESYCTWWDVFCSWGEAHCGRHSAVSLHNSETLWGPSATEGCIGLGVADSVLFCSCIKLLGAQFPSDQILVDKFGYVPVEKPAFAFVVQGREDVSAAHPPKRLVITLQSKMPRTLLSGALCCAMPSLGGYKAACCASTGSPGSAVLSAQKNMVMP